MGGEPLPVFVFGCMSCGKTVSGSEKSCPRCGASFDDVRFECPFCGELVSPGDSRCGRCGTEFSAFAAGVCEASAVDLDGRDMGPPPQDPGPEVVEYECPECGKRVSESDVQCPHCGVRFG
ncbi:MAG: hypothetical protein A3K67_03650 [Euryarchaeota archaeon RBG_16_62_10]|nr:MAG: hypothetical protein A3K67_03650 [Euryarchaeota archaeon RBG_16_62_10]